MPLSRRAFVARAAALGAISETNLLSDNAVAEASPAPVGKETILTLPPVTLRGYGAIAATFRVLDGGRASLTAITCESAQKARLMQAKYLSDLERLPGLRSESQVIKGVVISC